MWVRRRLRRPGELVEQGEGWSLRRAQYLLKQGSDRRWRVQNSPRGRRNECHVAVRRSLAGLPSSPRSPIGLGPIHASPDHGAALGGAGGFIGLNRIPNGDTDIVEERADDGVARLKDLTDGLGAHSVEPPGTQHSMMQAMANPRRDMPVRPDLTGDWFHRHKRRSVACPVVRSAGIRGACSVRPVGRTSGRSGGYYSVKPLMARTLVSTAVVCGPV